MFEKTKFFIVDMDGTFYLGDRMIPGADEFLRSVQESGRDYFFFSNNSSNSVDSCRARLEKIGFPVPKEKVLLSSFVASAYILRKYPGKTVYLLGNQNLYDCFRQAGIALTDEDPDIVVLGFDTDLTYERIRKACKYIADGAVYLATHPDRNCPTADGFMPDTGSMIEMFAASTGKYPIVLGKPMAPTVAYLAQKLGCEPQEMAFVGDRLETDIRIGTDNGIPTALVFSGVTDRNTLAASDIRPTVAVDSLRDLVRFL